MGFWIIFLLFWIKKNCYKSILLAPQYLLSPPLFFFNFNNILLSMLEKMMSYSSSLSDSGCLWWLIVKVGDWSRFCDVLTNGDYFFVYLFLYIFFISHKTHKKTRGTNMEYKIKKKKISY